MDKNNQKIITNICIGAALFCSIGALGMSGINFYRSSLNNISAVFDGNSANFTDGSIASVSSSVSPAVVSILTETRTYSYFGQSQTATAAGTGMIFSADGYILTNKHVIDGANTISVVTDDGTTYEKVELIGTDPSNDVAILKISDVSGLPTVTFGNSKTLSVGQQVIAIGNALGQYQNTVTEGIISGTGRSLVASDGDNSYEALSDMIQTDASINAGNSGGPLVNAAGEVIGINTAVADANGIGFAIPISSIKGIIRTVLETGKVERAYLGVSYTNVTAEVAKTYDLSVSYGAYISKSSGIVANSPAEKAGLKNGDIITAVNGIKIGASSSLSSLIGEYQAGDKITLSINRGGREFSVDVTLETYPTSTKR